MANSESSQHAMCRFHRFSRRKWTDFDQKCSDIGVGSANIGPKLIKLRSNSARYGPTSTTCSPETAKLGLDSAKHWPNEANIGPRAQEERLSSWNAY